MHNRPRSHTYRRIQARVAAVLLALAACVTGLLCVSAPALAEFSRPYISQITSAPTGSNGVQVPFGELGFGLGGLTVDPLSGNVYVGFASAGFAYEFNPSDEFIEQLTGLSSGSLAFDDEDGKLEGGGGPSRESDSVAVDDSTSPADKARGDVYFAFPIATGGGVDYDAGAVRRVNISGAPVPFACLENGKTPQYINGTGELTGKPGEMWGEYGSPGLSSMVGIAADSGNGNVASAGDIYVAIKNGGSGTFPSHVDEFTSEGCFLREFTGAMVPEKIPNGGDAFSRGVGGVAVDPTDGDVLIEALDSSGNDAIDEFSESGEFLGKITGVSKTGNFQFAGDGISVGGEGDMYVNSGEVVDRFGKGAFYPRVVTGAVSGAHPETVTLNGVVDGEGHGSGSVPV